MFIKEHSLKVIAFCSPQPLFLAAPLCQGFLWRTLYNCSRSVNLDPQTFGQTGATDSQLEVTDPRSVFSKFPGMTKLAPEPKQEHLGNGPRSWVSLYNVHANSSFKILLRLLLHDWNAIHSAWPQIPTQEIHCGIVLSYC